MQQVINNLVEAGKKRTAQQFRLTINQILNQAMENEYVYKNVARNIPLPKVQKPKKRQFTNDEKQIISLTELEKKEKAFIFSIYRLGLRRGEALALSKNDINLNDSTISIQNVVVHDENNPILKNMPKSAAGIRTLPITKELHGILETYINSIDSEYLFTMKSGELMSKSSYRKFFDKIIKKFKTEADSIGVEWGDDITAHTFRHNYCTDLYYAGIDIKTAQYLMGHSSIQMTMDVYTHLDNENVKTSAMKLEEYYNSDDKKVINFQSKVSQFKENTAN